MLYQIVSIENIITLQNSAWLIENYDFCFICIYFKFHFIQKSSNLCKRSYNPLAVLDRRTMSSAYIRQEICKSELPSDTGSQASFKHFVKSFRYKEKNVGLSTQPCFTPILVSKEPLKPFSVFIEYNKIWYISCIIFRNGPFILYLYILWKRAWLLMVFSKQEVYHCIGDRCSWTKPLFRGIM